MSLMGRLICLFPFMMAILFLGGVSVAILFSSPSVFLGSVFGIYLIPLFCFRLHEVVFPLKEGASDFSNPRYSPWWGSYQIQSIFISFPALEAARPLCALFTRKKL